MNDDDLIVFETLTRKEKRFCEEFKMKTEYYLRMRNSLRPDDFYHIDKNFEKRWQEEIASAVAQLDGKRDLQLQIQQFFSDTNECFKEMIKDKDFCIHQFLEGFLGNDEYMQKYMKMRDNYIYIKKLLRGI